MLQGRLNPFKPIAMFCVGLLLRLSLLVVELDRHELIKCWNFRIHGVNQPHVLYWSSKTVFYDTTATAAARLLLLPFFVASVMYAKLRQSPGGLLTAAASRAAISRLAVT